MLQTCSVADASYYYCP
jgi:hypothetical protein